MMGLGGNRETRGVQTIAYDAPGTGESPSRVVPRRMPKLARQAARLLDVRGLPRVDVLRVSFGGAVAQELVLRNRHRVDRLVLAGTMRGLGGIPGKALALMLLANPLRYYSPTFLCKSAHIRRR
jgi:poly(3-hydroxyoctanoate) depolymerase